MEGCFETDHFEIQQDNTASQLTVELIHVVGEKMNTGDEMWVRDSGEGEWTVIGRESLIQHLF